MINVHRVQKISCKIVLNVLSLKYMIFNLPLSISMKRRSFGTEHLSSTVRVYVLHEHLIKLYYDPILSFLTLDRNPYVLVNLSAFEVKI